MSMYMGLKVPSDWIVISNDSFRLGDSVIRWLKNDISIKQNLPSISSIMFYEKISMLESKFNYIIDMPNKTTKYLTDADLHNCGWQWSTF